MRILAIIDPPHLLRPKSDTSVAILEAAVNRGHQVSICELNELWIKGGEVGADVRAVTALSRTTAPAVTAATEFERVPLSHFHAVLMRKDPPFDPAYHHATLMLEYARGKTLLVNDPRGLREANEKLYIFHFPDLIAPTIVTRRHDELRAFLQAQGGQMVVKPLDGFGGSAVFHVRSDDPNTGSILETSTLGEKRPVMAQKYLDIEKNGDKRVLLLGGEPIGALLRMPPPNELRSNLAAGGTAQRTEITARDKQIIDRLRPRLLADGLHFVGLDIIGQNLTEVNVTSPTGVQAIDRLYDVRIEEKIVDYIERHAPRSL